ncbi:MAG: plasmid partitioning protein RepB [Stutzerimonas stutzeri]|nr:MAG: plasmid partitioning protein RepB [Stutzerimonas stutzeri]
MARDRRSILQVESEDLAPSLAPVGSAPEPEPQGKVEWLARKQPHGQVKDLQSLAARFGQSIRGESVVELDTEALDPSFVNDRMEVTDAEVAELANQIQLKGQVVPILVRPNPNDDSRYQIAYGHRRWRAAKALGIKVKAVVRDLTDEDLIVAQGQENNARSDLTYIEKARFAATLEDRGFGRAIISEAIAIHETDISTMIQIYQRLPTAVVEAIGKAPSIGRPRWLKLQKALSDEQALLRVETLIKTDAFNGLKSDERFSAVLQASKNSAAEPRKSVEDWVDPRGRLLAVIARSDKKDTIQFDKAIDAGFGEYVVEQLNALYAAYRAKS